MSEYVRYFINGVIVVLAVIALGGLLKTQSRVSKLKGKVEENQRKLRGRKKYIEGGMQEGSNVSMWEDTLGYLEELNKIQIKYVVSEQLIPLFPLFGILGTVLGIMFQMGDDIALMRQAVSTSITTTVAGLVTTIVLRLIDAIAVSPGINELLLRFDMDERDYHMVKDKPKTENNE